MASLQPSTGRHRLRVVALLAVLVAFDAAFVTAVYVLAHVAVALAPILTWQFQATVLFHALEFDVVPLWPVVAVGTPLTLVVQSVFGYRLTLREASSGKLGPEKGFKNVLLADRSEPEEPPEPTVVAAPALRQRVERLAQLADVATPSVTVVDSAAPNSYVASRPGERELIVTTALLRSLDDDELDAVLGHELAHLANGDAFVMTAAAFLPTVTGRFLDGAFDTLRRSAICRTLLGLDSEETIGAPQLEIPLLVFVIVSFPIVGALYLASSACYRLLSRIREYAADAGGVAISGSPAAMASALETLTTDLRPKTDLRTADTGVRELCVLPYAIDGGDDERPDDRLGRVQDRWDRLCDRVLPGSHPDPDERIGALGERQASLEDA